MAQVLFDTQSAVEDLKRGGFSDDQAKANVRFVREALEGGVATKSDVERLEARIDLLGADLRGEMNEQRTGLRGEMNELRTELRGEMSEHETFYANKKAKEMVGFAPQHGWRGGLL